MTLGPCGTLGGCNRGIRSGSVRRRAKTGRSIGGLGIHSMMFCQRENDMSESSARIRPNDGCGYLIGIFLVTCLLFIMNGMMAGVLFVRLRPLLPEWANRARYAQIFILAVPIGLILLEWFVWDWFLDRLRRRRAPTTPAQNE